MTKRIYTPKYRISSVENRIAILEAQGFDEQAEGLRDWFDKFINNENIAKKRSEYEKVIEELHCE